MKNVTFIFLFFLSFNLFAQNYITKFPNQDSTKTYSNSVMLGDSQNNLLMFYHEGDSLFYSKSVDNGSIWEGKKFVTKIKNREDFISSWYGFQYPFDGISTKDGKMMLFVNGEDILYSSDDGESWEVQYTVPFFVRGDANFSRLNDSTYWLLPGQDNKYYFTNDTGKTWATRFHKIRLGGKHNSSVTSLNDSTILLASNYYSQYARPSIAGRLSYDNGMSWTEKIIFVSSELDDHGPKILKQNDKYFILYSETESNPTTRDPIDLKYISSDNGFSWTDPKNVTEYLGVNRQPSFNVVSDSIWITLQSDRFMRDQIWFSNFENVQDTITPPYIEEVKGRFSNYLRESYKIESLVWDEERYKLDVKLEYSINSPTSQIKRFTYLDKDPSGRQKYFYETEVFGLEVGDTIHYRVIATDIDGYTAKTNQDTVIIEDESLVQKYMFNVNKFSLPIDNKGILGDLRIAHPERGLEHGGRFNGKVVLFSGGFGLSGYNSDGTLWTNGVNSASRVVDYIPGVIENTANLNDTSIYIIKKNDKPFGTSWLKWKDAVKLGAYYYDGDSNGKYEPVDINENGIWDSNEDRPDLLGDVTAWSVFNDATTSNLRRFSSVLPQGLEVRQTVWAYDNLGALQNSIFVRYSILNTGKTSQFHDSVYFSLWTDPAIGSESSAYTDDLAGCDTTLNVGYLFNDGNDPDFGNKPPCLIIKYLQGPVVPSSDSESFAYNRRGLIGEDSTKGFNNLPMTSFNWYGSATGYDDPDDKYQTRNYFLGRNQAGIIPDPCNWALGEVLGMSCEDVDPKYFYSGDPVTKSGWINIDPRQFVILTNTGPFKLEKGKPVELIAAYIVGDGESALNSITVGKEYAKQIQSFYENNFTQYVVGGIEEDSDLIPSELSLSQNYPNPFNPTTVIEYSIPKDVKRQTGNVKGPFIPSGVEVERVQLIVYDILGREVATLVNENQKPGNYKISFPRHSGEGRNLASGIYFYKLTYGSNIITKKMVLLK